ncbi:MAG: cytochrome c [Desulfobaccales bacterium]|jgi:mono/diheme cytochrome c family protein
MKTLVTVLSLLLIGIAGSAWAQGGSADNGKALVDSKHCALCHKEGGNLGKPMDQVVGSHDDAYLKGALLDPKKTLGPTIKMPAFKLSDAEVADVIAYLKSIKH